jgi:hypothetical protein
MQYLLPQETQGIPNPPGPLASLMAVTVSAPLYLIVRQKECPGPANSMGFAASFTHFLPGEDSSTGKRLLASNLCLCILPELPKIRNRKKERRARLRWVPAIARELC